MDRKLDERIRTEDGIQLSSPPVTVLSEFKKGVNGFNFLQFRKGGFSVIINRPLIGFDGSEQTEECVGGLLGRLQHVIQQRDEAGLLLGRCTSCESYSSYGTTTSR